MNAYIVVHPVPKHLKQMISIKDGDFLIAVDQAVEDVILQGFHINLAVGDFDSLKNHALLKGLEVLRLDVEKDLTDTESALIYASKMGFKAINLVGGLGGLRFEHSYANILLLSKFKNLSIITEQSKVFKLSVGRHKLEFDGYVSLFALEDSILSLEGFKYLLNDYELNITNSIGISNEIVDSFGIVDIKYGSLLVFLTKKEQ